MTARRKGEPRAAAPPPTGSFGDAAGESGNDTEVEEPMAGQQTADTSEDSQHAAGPDQDAVVDDAAFADETAAVEEEASDGASGSGDASDASVGTTGPQEQQGHEEQQEPEGPLDAAQLEQALAERTADLQRLQAEYVNYKRRVDRDRELVRENATYAALAPIVDVLDTIDRAREHGDLDQGFQAVAEQLERVVAKAGLVKYGEPGEAFDPRLHEALSHIGEDPEVEVTTCKVIAKAGYRIGERVVRAAQVLVVDPAAG